MTNTKTLAVQCDRQCHPPRIVYLVEGLVLREEKRGSTLRAAEIMDY